MPYHMKDGRWRGHKMFAGQRKTKIFKTKTEAKLWEAGQKEEEWQRQEEQTLTVCLHDVANLYLDYSMSRHDKRTYEAKRLAFKRLFSVVDAQKIPDELTLKLALFVLAKTARAISNAAANKDRKHLSAFWEFGKKYHGFPLLNPFQQIERFPEKPGNHYVPPADDFWKVYAMADRADKVLLLALLHTAGRRSEVLHLTWDDVDFAHKKIRLSTCKTRDGSRKRVWLTMTSDLHDALADHRALCGKTEYVFTSKTTGEPYSDRKHFVEHLCKRARVKPFNYHGIRGLSATLLAQKIPVHEIRSILRHSSLTTTERYIRSLGVTTDRLNEVFEDKKAASKIIPFKAAQ
ncbi:MAG: tyrosine-type recombinase/integrase [Desulfovibrio sp.]|nr:tyrosine-type recombinase/integrase [Desulfovibrio sp.]